MGKKKENVILAIQYKNLDKIAQSAGAVEYSDCTSAEE